jgi:hypothetical protein
MLILYNTVNAIHFLLVHSDVVQWLFTYSNPLIAAEATSFVIATKEAKRPSCCDHLTAAPAPCWPGRNSGPLRFFAWSLGAI